MDVHQIRVLVADDHPIVRRGLCALLSEEADMAVVAQAKDAAEAVELCRRHEPDVLVMDLRMPGMSVLEAVRTLRAESPTLHCIILTTYVVDEDVIRLLEAGVQGYVLKDCYETDLTQAIRVAF